MEMPSLLRPFKSSSQKFLSDRNGNLSCDWVAKISVCLCTIKSGMSVTDVTDTRLRTLIQKWVPTYANWVCVWERLFTFLWLERPSGAIIHNGQVKVPARRQGMVNGFCIKGEMEQARISIFEGTLKVFPMDSTGGKAVVRWNSCHGFRRFIEWDYFWVVLQRIGLQ